MNKTPSAFDGPCDADHTRQTASKMHHKSLNCKCETCGNLFYRRPSDLFRRGKHNFCSKKCFGGFHSGKRAGNWKGGITKEPHFCINCGRPFFIDSLNRMTNNRSKFCSEKCRNITQSGEGAPSWKGGISFKPYCSKFNDNLKERVRAFFGYRCVLCGAVQQRKKLGIHHVNFNKNACCDNSAPLFVPLCDSCHGVSGHNRKYWERCFTNLINDYFMGKCYLTHNEFALLMDTKPVQSRKSACPSAPALLIPHPRTLRYSQRPGGRCFHHPAGFFIHLPA